MNERKADLEIRSGEPVLASGEVFRQQAGEVIEVALLLSAGQMSALEAEAHHRGLTAGEMVRRLLHDFIGPPQAISPSLSCKAAAS
jgi:hypothetical protein